jgi:hypothetical protein
MLRSLLFLVLGIWVLRTLQASLSRPKRPHSSDFHPKGGAADPAPAPVAEDAPAFSSVDVVDGEFEEIPGPPGS